jgi:polyhydroxyalkanoate synthesis regulator phasin
MPAHWIVTALPFLLILVLWFFLLKQVQKAKFGYQNTVIEPMREVLQTEIVPEIRALRESIDALRKEIADRR